MVGGCKSTPEPQSKPTVAQQPVKVSEYEKVYLNNIPKGTSVSKINDKRDVRQIVSLAIALSDKNRHAESAEIFAQASKDFKSKGGVLEQHLISAAICEYFQAGEIAKVREYLKLLDSYRTSVYDKFDDNESVASIRKTISKK